ncbi:MAG: hypothetical protein HRT68_04545 [Flavobacteriaceae bacterium]|nr:hypothetical protein [Flavobacteriaceae bacterium]
MIFKLIRFLATLSSLAYCLFVFIFGLTPFRFSDTNLSSNILWTLIATTTLFGLVHFMLLTWKNKSTSSRIRNLIFSILYLFSPFTIIIILSMSYCPHWNQRLTGETVYEHKFTENQQITKGYFLCTGNRKTQYQTKLLHVRKINSFLIHCKEITLGDIEKDIWIKKIE